MHLEVKESPLRPMRASHLPSRARSDKKRHANLNPACMAGEKIGELQSSPLVQSSATITASRACSSVSIQQLQQLVDVRYPETLPQSVSSFQNAREHIGRKRFVRTHRRAVALCRMNLQHPRRFATNAADRNGDRLSTFPNHANPVALWQRGVKTASWLESPLFLVWTLIDIPE